MPLELTVAIPTYNGADRLPQVLDRLRQQVVPDDLRWEVIVVDNNSTDDIQAAVNAARPGWPAAVPLRYELERQQGAAFARQRAVEVAEGTWVGFLDDDNWPAPDWVARACAFARDADGQDDGQDTAGGKAATGNPGVRVRAASPKEIASPPENRAASAPEPCPRPSARLGAFGSRIRGNFGAAELPPDFHRIRPFLAVTDRGDRPLRYLPRLGLLPPSAGLVVRRRAWLESVPPQLILSGRTTTSMLTSEDLEMLIYLQRAGWEIWYNPAMRVEHQISPWRLRRSYLLPFFRGIGLSRYVIRMLRLPRWQRPFWTAAYAANDCRRILRHWWRYRATLPENLVAACELEFYRSSLVSPWFTWRHLRRSRDRAASPSENRAASPEENRPSVPTGLRPPSALQERTDP